MLLNECHQTVISIANNFLKRSLEGRQKPSWYHFSWTTLYVSHWCCPEGHSLQKMLYCCRKSPAYRWAQYSLEWGSAQCQRTSSFISLYVY